MSKPEIHLICNAHLDPVWQWQWEEGAAEAFSTFVSAVNLLNEHPAFIFNHNEALLYQWVKKYRPSLFRSIQELHKKGRWSISGGWFLQPDVNMPGTEAIIRQIEIGRLFFKEHFNTAPRTAYNFDSFGHSAGLPQILTKAGYDFYIHQRPEKEFLVLPDSLYRWKGIDGSLITAYRIEIGLYHTEYDNMRRRMEEGAELSLQKNRPVAVFWGIGDHGGGATRNDLEIIDKFIDDNSDVSVIHSTPDMYYRAIKGLEPELEVYEGGLQRVFVGCYASMSRVKRGAVSSLHNLIQSEKLTAAAAWLKDMQFSKMALPKAWEAHLFNDFHDILPGTCIKPAEEDALGLYGYAGKISRRLRLQAINALCGGNAEYELPVTIVNTNSTIIHSPVEVEFMISHRPKWKGEWRIELFDRLGNEISCQEEQPEARLPFNGWRRKISFQTRLPHLGSLSLLIKPKEGKQDKQDHSSALPFRFSEHTGLVSHLEDENGVALLRADLMRPLVVKDEGDSWGTGFTQFRDVVGHFETVKEKCGVIEKGPVRIIYESHFRYNNSTIAMRTIGYSGFPVIEYRLRINWGEPQRRLQLSLPTTLSKNTFLSECIGGFIEQPADGDERVQSRWSLLQGDVDGSDRAFGICHSGQHSISVKDGEARITLLRSAAYCHEQGENLDNFLSSQFMDLGTHEIKLLVTAGSPEMLLKQISGYAEWLNSPPFALAHLPIDKESALFSELLTLKPENVELLSARYDQDKDRLLLRIRETAGIAAKAEISLSQPEMSFTGNLKPFEIKSIEIKRNGEFTETDFLHLLK